MKISVVAHTGSKKQKIEKREGVFHVYISEKPIDGLANTAITKVLSEYFNVAKSKVVLKLGLKSKNKVFEVYE